MQSKRGCCVGNTYEEIVALIQFMLYGTQANPDTDEELSFRFVYAMCKALEGKILPVEFRSGADDSGNYMAWGRTAGADDGTYPSLAAQVIRKYGVPLAKYCPNDVDLDADSFCYGRDISKIPSAAIADAAKRKAGADITEQISVAGIKASIAYARANKGGVAILRRIGAEYWTKTNGSSSWKRADLLPMRAPSPVQSGHEELVYGYLDMTVKDRANLIAGKTTVDELIAKYPESAKADSTRSETLILWLNHWSQAWCSTSGIEGGKHKNDMDGGRGYEFVDVWLPYINELRISVATLPPVNPGFRYTFKNNLERGMRGADVVALQHVLDLEGCFSYEPTDGSQKYTGNYLDLTVQGVTKLQDKYASAILAPLGLKKGTGVFWDSTRAWVNKKYGINS